MKTIEIGDQKLTIKDYHCAVYGCEYFPKTENKLWLYINITDLCNAGCPFCVNPSRKDGTNPFSAEAFARTLKNAAPFVYGVSITGGEPMLQPELIDEVASIVTQTLATSVELDLVTNGTNIDALTRLKSLTRFESIHISRHRIDDCDNASLFGTNVPGIGEIRDLVSSLKDPAQIVFNCVMMKGGVSTAADMSEYLEMAAWAGVRNTSFVGMFMANRYCRDNYVSPADIDVINDVIKDHRFQIWNTFSDHEYCICRNGDYKAKNGYTRFYFRCPGSQKAEYCRQLVYTADNRLLNGFGGTEIHFE